MFAACALGATGGWNIANTGAAAEQLAGVYSVDTAQIGILSAILFLTQFVGQIPTGHLIDHLGARNAAWACIGVFGIANLLACATPSYELALFCRALMGPAMALSFIGASAFIRGADGSSFAQGVFGAVSTGFGGLALAVVPTATAHFGWRAPFAGGVVIALLSVPAIMAAPDARFRLRGSAGLRSTLAMAKDPVLWKLGVIQANAFGLNAIIANWVVLLVEKNSAASIRLAGIIGAMTLVGGVISRPLGGLLVARYPMRSRLIVSSSIALGALATTALAIGLPVTPALLATLGVGLAAGVSFGPIMDLAGRTHPGSPGAAIAFLNTGAMGLIVIGTPAVGASFSLPGDGRIGFAAIALIWLLSIPAASVFSTKRPARDETPPTA